MGVDITAYSRLNLVEPACPEPDGYCEIEDHIEAFAYADHARSFEGLADADVQKAVNGSRFIGGRCYVETDRTETHDILTMSYSGYNRWRATLCRAIHGIEPEEFWADLDRRGTHAFADLINFADNEGCIGPIAAERLLADFRADGAREKFRVAMVDLDASRRNHYFDAWDDWITGLKLAADGGMVKFS